MVASDIARSDSMKKWLFVFISASTSKSMARMAESGRVVLRAATTAREPEMAEVRAEDTEAEAVRESEHATAEERAVASVLADETARD